MEREFFLNLPPGKTRGFCEPVEGSSDGGVVVEIRKDCRRCTVGKCMMFAVVYDEKGKVVGRKFTPHPPEY